MCTSDFIVPFGNPDVTVIKLCRASPCFSFNPPLPASKMGGTGIVTSKVEKRHAIAS